VLIQQSVCQWTINKRRHSPDWCDTNDRRLSFVQTWLCRLYDLQN